MKLLRTLKSFLPRVKLRPLKGLTLDLRDPWLVARHEHRQRRLRECRKVTAPTYFPVVPQSAPKGGRSSHIDPAKQRPSGRAELQPTALHCALADPGMLRHQAD